MIDTSIRKFQEMRQLVSRIPGELYIREIEVIGNATIGKHIRHVLEFYQAVFNNSNNVVCYDDRRRDERLETDPEFALACIDQLCDHLRGVKTDHPVFLSIKYGSSPDKISSSLYRELAYALDHSIHHLAIIRILLNIVSPEFEMDPALGVAPSTLRFNSSQPFSDQ